MKKVKIDRKEYLPVIKDRKTLHTLIDWALDWGIEFKLEVKEAK